MRKNGFGLATVEKKSKIVKVFFSNFNKNLSICETMIRAVLDRKQTKWLDFNLSNTVDLSYTN